MFEEAGIPDIVAAMQGQEFQAAYSLDDMADDAVGLLDALGIEKAHICGVSMGVMITQVIGYRHPSRVLSLIPIMGTTGNPALPRAKPEAMEMLIIPNPEEREAYIEYSVIMWKIFWGSLHFDEDIVRKRAAVSYDRAFCPQGIPRQHAAIISNGNRKSRLDPFTIVCWIRLTSILLAFTLVFTGSHFHAPPLVSDVSLYGDHLGIVELERFPLQRV